MRKMILIVFVALNIIVNGQTNTTGETKTKKANNWFGYGFSWNTGSVSYRYLSSSSEKAILDSRNANEKWNWTLNEENNNGYNIGLSIMYKFSDRMSVLFNMSNLYIGYHTSEFKLSLNDTAVNQMGNSYDIYHTIDPFNGSVGNGYVDDRFTYIIDNNKEYTYARIKHNIVYQFAHFPMLLRYDIFKHILCENKELNLYCLAGPSLDIMIKDISEKDLYMGTGEEPSNQYLDGTTWNQPHELTEKTNYYNKFNYSASVSVGVEVVLNNNWRTQLQTDFQYMIKPMLKDETVKEHLYCVNPLNLVFIKKF